MPRYGSDKVGLHSPSAYARGGASLPLHAISTSLSPAPLSAAGFGPSCFVPIGVSTRKPRLLAKASDFFFTGSWCSTRPPVGRARWASHRTKARALGLSPTRHWLHTHLPPPVSAKNPFLDLVTSNGRHPRSMVAICKKTSAPRGFLLKMALSLCQY